MYRWLLKLLSREGENEGENEGEICRIREEESGIRNSEGLEGQVDKDPVNILVPLLPKWDVAEGLGPKYGQEAWTRLENGKSFKGKTGIV